MQFPIVYVKVGGEGCAMAESCEFETLNEQKMCSLHPVVWGLYRKSWATIFCKV